MENVQFKPVDLLTWSREWLTHEEYKKYFAYQGAISSWMFMRDQLPYAFLPEDIHSIITPMVVGEHRSKSVILPVVEFVIPGKIKVTMRDNFYDFNISVETSRPVTNLMGFAEENDLNYCFFQGFPGEAIFQSTFKENPCRFSSYTHNKYQVYGLCQLLAYQFKV